MTQQASNYAKVLLELSVDESVIDSTRTYFMENEELLEALASPIIEREAKHRVIDKIFDKSITKFLKVVCDNGNMNDIDDILSVYEDVYLDSKNVVKATLYYVSEPDDNQISGFKKMICNKYRKSDVRLQMIKDKSLIGGFILRVYDDEYDRSIRGMLTRMQTNLTGR